MILFVYNLLLALTLPLLLGYYGGRAFWRGKRLEGWRDRLGYSYGALKQAIGSKPVIWIHAVSVGEAIVAVPLVKCLKDRYPSYFILITTVTATGREVLKQRIPGLDATRYFPIDLRSAVNRSLDAVRPVLFIALETEIWPNFIDALSRRRIPSGILNGRISPGSFRGYHAIRWVMKSVLRKLLFLGMQTQEDADRILALGAPPDRVMVMGNMKYDGSMTIPIERLESLRKGLGFDNGPAEGRWKLWVSGSTHAGEEEQILDAYQQVASEHPELRLAIAPRHPERFAEVAALLDRAGLPYLRLSDGREGDVRSSSEENLQGRSKTGPIAIVLVDTLGDLQALYGLADFVFVGGSLVPVGGHNIMEPAAWGKPLLFGPYMFNFSDVAHQMKDRDGAIEVGDTRSLVEALKSLLQSPEAAKQMGQRALGVVLENRGALERGLALVSKQL